MDLGSPGQSGKPGVGRKQIMRLIIVAVEERHDAGVTRRDLYLRVAARLIR